ncbi:energy-coupling factor ABC transporter ATP-binding protein [Sporolactobacillus shoreicorticis]|uniref:Energy-coupling factor ABC transporter ATP-binding protein n=1 Tax=Sporolactobacillus shoreicorticis TaxID=1923877 RepID=A0ABW5S8R7_9BACL|nr:energy-coupling factor ABC transporter ATP-binding protein [Sporolactobacillus shoreicorticis]MCO7127421.1 energy-coupling factor ABC transporter ATP-binding protein [Sporolactobacillus shoreicorticis]
MEKIIEVSDLSYRYSEEQPYVLKNINFTVNKGEWLSIVGHNGSGKSTLAKCLNGLILPQRGTVNVGGFMTSDEEKIWEIRRLVGMVFQNPDNQFVGATVQDDVAFGMENHGLSREIMAERLSEALRLVRMDQFAKSEPHRLSGGQKQRVAIAGIVALQPLIIIMDESTSMLDPEGRKEIIQTVRALNRDRHLTVISITHDLEEAIHSDRLLVMNDGELIREGKPHDLFKSTALLRKIGLDLPFAIKMRNVLRAKGVPLSDTALFQEELVDELWTLHSSM